MRGKKDGVVRASCWWPGCKQVCSAGGWCRVGAYSLVLWGYLGLVGVILWLLCVFHVFLCCYGAMFPYVVYCWPVSEVACLGFAGVRSWGLISYFMGLFGVILVSLCIFICYSVFLWVVM